MYARAAAAAAIALLVGGDVVRLGWDAARLWHFVFPYLWTFVLLESMRARRRVEDGETFLAGAAVALLYAGVYAKDLQHGWHPFGVDWLSVPCAAFDGGMTTLLAAHLVERLRPRGEQERSDGPDMLTMAFLVFVAAGAALVYLINTVFNFYKADRMLDATWLAADIGFAWLAWKAARSCLEHSENETPLSRDGVVWAVAAFSVWLPGARFLARAADGAGLPAILIYFIAGVWTAVAAWLFHQSWKERGHHPLEPVGESKLALWTAAFRAGACLVLVLWLGDDLNMPRGEAMFSALISWPTRAAFAWLFFTSRLKV